MCFWQRQLCFSAIDTGYQLFLVYFQIFPADRDFLSVLQDEILPVQSPYLVHIDQVAVMAPDQRSARSHLLQFRQAHREAFLPLFQDNPDAVVPVRFRVKDPAQGQLQALPAFFDKQQILPAFFLQSFRRAFFSFSQFRGLTRN